MPQEAYVLQDEEIDVDDGSDASSDKNVDRHIQWSCCYVQFLLNHHDEKNFKKTFSWERNMYFVESLKNVLRN